MLTQQRQDIRQQAATSSGYTMSGVVYFDINKNNVKDANEPPFGGGTVRLAVYDDQGASPRFTAPADQAGRYTISGAGGTYNLAVYAIKNFEDYNVQNFSITRNLTHNIGLKPAPEVSFAGGSYEKFGYVYHDVNGNGVKDAGEPGLPSVIVTFSGNNNEVLIRTNQSGYYNFLSLPSVLSYCIKAVAPSGYGSSLTGRYESFKEVCGGAEGASLNIGFTTTSQTPYTLKGQVYADLNKNGIKDANEEGIPSIELALRDIDGYSKERGLLNLLYTNTEGQYEFKYLESGGNNFNVYFSLFPGSRTTTSPIALAQGGRDSVVDFGVNLDSTVNGIVYFDDNSNNLYEMSTSVTLLSCSRDQDTGVGTCSQGIGGAC